MGLMAKDTGGGDFKQVPEGIHTARCYRIIDLGTQHTTYMGAPKITRQVRIGWEVFGEPGDMDFIAPDGKPLTTSKVYTLSLGSKANLRKDLESWRGRKFTEEEAGGFELANLLDQYCQLQIIHETKNGKTYANINSILALTKSMRSNLPQGVHPTQLFNVEEPDEVVFEALPDFIKNKIRESDEWRARESGAKPLTRKMENKVAFVDDEDERDIPF